MQDLATIRGEFEIGSLPQAIQYLAGAHPNGRLELINPPKKAVLYVSGGNIVAASSGVRYGEEAIVQVLSWPAGQFVFYRELVNIGILPGVSHIFKPMSSLLLSASAQRDERDSQLVVTIEVSSNSVPILRPPQAGQSVRLETGMLALMPRINGQHSVQEIAQLINLPVEVVLDQIETLASHGLVEIIRQAQLVPEAFLVGVNKLMVQLMGPFGEVLIDDAANETGIDLDQLTHVDAKKLLLALDQKVAKERQASFRAVATNLLTQFGIT